MNVVPRGRELSFVELGHDIISLLLYDKYFIQHPQNVINGRIDMITNYFSPLEFQVNIKRLPNVEFFVQRTAIPSVSGNPAIMPTPFNKLNITPDKLQYGPLELTFIIDETLSNYMEIFNWIKGTTFPERYSQYRNLDKSEYGLESDITIIALNSHKNPIIKITFTNCAPVTLSEITLDTTQSDLVYPEATATFSYDYFDITPYID